MTAPSSSDPESDPEAGIASSARAKPRRLREGIAIPLVGLAIWSLYPLPSFGALLAAYGIAWLLANLIKVLAPRMLSARLTAVQWLVIAGLIACAPIARAVGLAERLLEDERLEAVNLQLAARRRLEDTPAIAPPLVSWDLPQTFYVHAEDAREVTVALVPDRALPTTALGHGLFRLEYDPRRDGRGTGSGPLDVRIAVDGEGHHREMTSVAQRAHPRWLDVSPGGDAIAATSEETDELIVATERGLRFVTSTDDGPIEPRFVGANRIAVAHRYGTTLAIHDATNGARLESIEVGARGVHLAISPQLDLLALSREREIVLVSVTPFAIVQRVALDFAPEWVAFGADANTLVVSERYPANLHRLRRVDDTLLEDVPPIALIRPVVTLTRSEDGHDILLSVTDYQAAPRAHLGNHFVRDQIVRVDVERFRVAASEPTATRTARQDSPGNVDRGVSPIGLHVSADGARWIAFAGTDDVLRVARDGTERRFTLDGVPIATPISAVPFASGGFAVSSAAYGAIGLFDAEGALVRLLALAPSDADLLRDDQLALQRRLGERDFYESTRAGVSCQSCHLHAGSDQGRHNIGGSTLVATLDVRGALGTPPYLRDGGYPFLGSLHELAITLYRGYRRTQGGRTVSLDRYLSDLPREPPRRQLGGHDAPSERRGLDAFVKARCVLCHAFPAFTNLGQHPPRTIFEGFEASLPSEQLDTPSLFGLAESPPYLVDGRALTLAAIFDDHDPARRHGNRGALTDAERRDLLYFIEGL